MATKKSTVVVEIKTDSTQATTEANKTKDSLLSGTTTPDAASLLDDLTGPIKRQM